MDINILYEDNHILIIDNPVLQQQQTYQKESPIKALKSHLLKHQNKKNIYLRPIPLIEYPIGGTQIFVKSSKAYYRLNKQKRARQIKKLYFAVVRGVIFGDYGTLTNYLTKDKRGRLHIVTQTHPRKFQSTLSYIVLDRTKNLTLIAIPSTHGKSEQIRLQLMAWGHSILGEDKYCWSIEQASSLALHTIQVRFYHPTKDRKMNFIGPFPISHPWNLFMRFSDSREAVNFVHQQFQSNRKKFPHSLLPK